MDIASLIGVLIGAACLGGVLFEVSHGHLMMFFSMEGVLMVGGGSISVLFMALPMEKVKKAMAYVRKFMFFKGTNPSAMAKTVAELAEKARRDGILAIEQDLERLEKVDPFLAAGLKMAVDGTAPEIIETTLRIEVMAMKERHKAGKKFFDLVKLYGPGWALVGTLVGQIGMFGNLEGADVGKLGQMLAIAVCATMYGTVLANAVAGPIGDKLALRSSEEILSKEMAIQGILSIQSGDNPRMTLEKMSAFLTITSRKELKMAA